MMPMILRKKITEREKSVMTLLKWLATPYFPLHRWNREWSKLTCPLSQEEWWYKKIEHKIPHSLLKFYSGEPSALRNPKLSFKKNLHWTSFCLSFVFLNGYTDKHWLATHQELIHQVLKISSLQVVLHWQVCRRSNFEIKWDGEMLTEKQFWM